MNRPFRVPPSLSIKTRLSAWPLIRKWFFIVVEINLIFTRKVVLLGLFWKWGFLELESGLLKRRRLVFFFTNRIKKNLAVKYITVLPLLNTKKKTSSFTENSLGPLTCKTSDNLNFYNTDTSVMRILSSVPFGVPFKMVWLSRLWQKVTLKTSWISIVNQSF